jgi:undecaprenyl-diphosphatase
MQLFHFIILGLIQGLTEFFPISSSGHLVILPWLFGLKAHPLIFDIILHLATFCAVIVYFRRDWIGILREGLLSIRERNLKGPIQRRIFWAIIIASIPGVIFGSIFGSIIEDYFRSPMPVAVMLGLFGLVLYAAEIYGKKDKSLADITWRIALLIGISQMFALIPGVSRSGITISAAIALGMNRDSSVRFSFLLGAPIVFAAACYSIGTGNLAKAFESFPWQPLLAGFAASFASSLIAIHFLLKFVRRHPFTVFAVYRLALSAAIIIILLCK